MLRDTNRDMDQQRTIDMMKKERRETFCFQAQMRQEVEKERTDAEQKVCWYFERSSLSINALRACVYMGVHFFD